MSDPYFWLVLAPVIGLVSLGIFHLLIARVTGGRRAYGCALRGFIGGLGITILASVLALKEMGISTADWIALFLFNLIIYAALGYGYINFVGLSIASLRIRVLQELLIDPDGMTREKILQRYNTRVLMDNRITRLTSGRQIIEKDGRFYTRPSAVLYIARVINLLKFIVLGKRRGGKKS